MDFFFWGVRGKGEKGRGRRKEEESRERGAKNG